MKNFWKILPKPFFALAPMDDVTDTVFRQMVCKTARPDVFFTEFTNVDAMASKGREKVLPRLRFENIEHPVVAQIWGIDPENFYEAAKDIKKMGFDGIDINMGCPISGVIKKGACAALIKNHKLAKEIIEATIKGIQSAKKGSDPKPDKNSSASNLGSDPENEVFPISVKTRLGFDKIETEKWIGFLLSLGLDAITIHGRTVQEMSKVPAHWDVIKEIVELRNKMRVDTLVVGNGDVENYQDGLKKVKESGVDGIMIGRGIFKDPFCFENPKKTHTLKESIKILIEHAKLFESIWGKTKNFASLRKFFKAYIHGFEGANDLRIKLMETNSYKDVSQALKNFTD